MMHLLLAPPSLIREMSCSEIDKQIIKSVRPTSKLMFPSCRVVHSRCWATRALVRKGNDHRTRIYQNTGRGRVTSDTMNNIKEGRKDNVNVWALRMFGSTWHQQKETGWESVRISELESFWQWTNWGVQCSSIFALANTTKDFITYLCAVCSVMGIMDMILAWNNMDFTSSSSFL